MKFNFLTKDFFEKYKDCKEIEKKEDRPYSCVTLIKYKNLYFAIPLRSNINLTKENMYYII